MDDETEDPATTFARDCLKNACKVANIYYPTSIVQKPEIVAALTIAVALFETTDMVSNRLAALENYIDDTNRILEAKFKG